jgi:hypothetical protein
MSWLFKAEPYSRGECLGGFFAKPSLLPESALFDLPEAESLLWKSKFTDFAKFDTGVL